VRCVNRRHPPANPPSRVVRVTAVSQRRLRSDDRVVVSRGQTQCAAGVFNNIRDWN
jgi:hypothetical protein